MKKNKSNLPSALILVLGSVATIMLFFPALTFPNSDTSFLGYEVVFGSEFINVGAYSLGQIVWSPIGIIAFILPVIAAIVMVTYKKAVVISFLMFTLSAVLLFTLPLYIKTTVQFFGTINIDWSMAYGLIIAAIFSSLGSLTCLFQIANNK